MQHIDFYESLKSLGDRVSKMKDTIKTEEATKMALVAPFIQTLGYDVFNPTEVTPELIADVGTKKGEKVDYAILKEGQPMIIVECKHHAGALTIENAAQLARYFHVTTARFAILTNGFVYKFFTDLVDANKMDEKPFFEFDISNISEIQTDELKKFHKTAFDLQTILSTANELKYSKAVKDLFMGELSNPSVDFIKYLADKTYDGRISQKVVDLFTGIVKKSLQMAISEIISSRLRSALANEVAAAKEHALPNATETEKKEEEENKIETTMEEMEAFFIIKSLLRGQIDAARIFYRDSQSYFSILLDDSNRKPICRLYLNGARKQIGLFDESKKENKVELKNLDSIYAFTDAIVKAAASYKE